MPHSGKARNIFTIPPSAGFLDALAQAVLAGTLPGGVRERSDPFELTKSTILLPTRRAARGLQEAFLQTSRRLGGRSALLLPAMRPIAEGEEDATLLAGVASRTTLGTETDIPPAVSELERRLVLMQFVQQWSRLLRDAGPADGDDLQPFAAAGARTPAQAAHLAQELARLIDMVETEGVKLDQLAALVPETFSEHWQQTLNFLDIVVSQWPGYLLAAQRLSPADRRNRVILAEADRLAAQGSTAPVIVAGVTGSIPATASLIKVVAGLPQGTIVLPGLDTDIAASESEDIINSHPEHPQYGLLRLLRALGTSPARVQILPGLDIAQAPADRFRLIGETLRPASSTHRWRHLRDAFTLADAQAAFAGVTYLPTPNAQDEAEAISLILREAAETPGKTAALVSPDRLLARRVAIRLESWGIRIDDSAGRPFPKTVTGAFLDLVITAAAKSFAPKPLMALLKHPLARLGRPAVDVRRAARALEIAAFRAPYIGDGLDGLEAALEKAAQDVETGRRRGRAISRLWQDDWDSARQLIADLRAAYEPLEAVFCSADAVPLHEIVAAHVATAEALAAIPEDATGCSELWRDAAGVEGAQLIAGLLEPDLPAPQLKAIDYPDFYRALVAGEAVRPHIPTHPRIFIWGPFEARLLRPDVIVLGSLNEGTWPEAADPGPWLNRPMRRELGLPSPEEQIGYAAHDFTQLLGADTVYLTRSEMVDGNPSVPSRWLLRLQAVLASLDARTVIAQQTPWLEWARSRDTIADAKRIARPEPRPPLELRPRKLSVSGVETWIANPYALFAERILKLDALPPLGQHPDASLRGSIVHEALGRFAQQHSTALPNDPAAELLAIAERLFAELGPHPRIAAFWQYRFARFAAWFAANEANLRGGAELTLGEVAGSTIIEAPGGPFTLTARADRIDISEAQISITDYKTGQNLSQLATRAREGKRPQLLLEALIAKAAGFANVQANTVAELRYISASGGDPPGAIVPIKLDAIDTAVEQVANDLAAMIARFDDVTTPYVPTRRALFNYDYDDYAHLARIDEWAGDQLDGEDT